MAFYEDFEACLYRATEEALEITGYSEVEIAYANDAYLEPDKTYCVINVIELEQKGRTNEDTFLTGGIPTLSTVTHYSAHIQYSIIGSDARKVAPEFRHTVVNNRACFMAYAEQNLGLLDRSRLRNIPQKRDTQWVPCFNFDVELSFALTQKQELNWVEWVKINDDWYPETPPETP